MQWATEGTAYTYDFDRFEIEYAPGQATTFKFVPLTPGNSIWVAGPDETVGIRIRRPEKMSFDTWRIGLKTRTALHQLKPFGGKMM